MITSSKPNALLYFEFGKEKLRKRDCGRGKSAGYYFDKSLELDPSLIYEQLELVNEAEKQQNYVDIIFHLQLILNRLDSENLAEEKKEVFSIALNKLGNACLQVAKDKPLQLEDIYIEMAENCYIKASELDKDDIIARMNLGYTSLCIAQSKSDKFKELYEKGIITKKEYQKEDRSLFEKPKHYFKEILDKSAHVLFWPWKKSKKLKFFYNEVIDCAHEVREYGEIIPPEIILKKYEKDEIGIGETEDGNLDDLDAIADQLKLPNGQRLILPKHWLLVYEDSEILALEKLNPMNIYNYFKLKNDDYFFGNKKEKIKAENDKIKEVEWIIDMTSIMQVKRTAQIFKEKKYNINTLQPDASFYIQRFETKFIDQTIKYKLFRDIKFKGECIAEMTQKRIKHDLEETYSLDKIITFYKGKIKKSLDRILKLYKRDINNPLLKSFHLFYIDGSLKNFLREFGKVDFEKREFRNLFMDPIGAVEHNTCHFRKEVVEWFFKRFILDSIYYTLEETTIPREGILGLIIKRIEASKNTKRKFCKSYARLLKESYNPERENRKAYLIKFNEFFEQNLLWYEKKEILNKLSLAKIDRHITITGDTYRDIMSLEEVVAKCEQKQPKVQKYLSLIEEHEQLIAQLDKQIRNISSIKEHEQLIAQLDKQIKSISSLSRKSFYRFIMDNTKQLGQIISFLKTYKKMMSSPKIVSYDDRKAINDLYLGYKVLDKVEKEIQDLSKDFIIEKYFELKELIWSNEFYAQIHSEIVRTNLEQLAAKQPELIELRDLIQEEFGLWNANKLKEAA